jgi:hypothetical protein
MWPRFDPPTGAITVKQVVDRGKDAIIAPAALFIAACSLVGLVVAVCIRWSRIGDAQFGWPGSLVAAVAAFAGMAVGFLGAWLWNARVIGRWWDWAVGTGVDLDKLVEEASGAQLISRTDAWWQERASTKRARDQRDQRQAR